MRKTAIMNLKGGTAKTITAINMAAILARDYAMRILLVDADSQANLTEFVTPVDQTLVPGGFADLLRGQEAMPQPTKMKNVKILHGDETLMDLDISSAGCGRSHPMALDDFLQSPGIRDSFDWCIIDCPPAFSAGAMAALIAADEVVIPLKLDAFGIRGLANLMEQIRNMRRINPDLEIAGVLPTMYYSDGVQREAEADLRGSLARAGIRTFHHITRSAGVDESTFGQRPLIECKPKSKACHAYKLLCRDLVNEDGGDF